MLTPVIPPAFMAFSILDYFQFPQYAVTWFFLKLIPVGYFLIAWHLLKRSSKLRQNIEWFLVPSIVLFAHVSTLTIWQTGSFRSPYILSLPVICYAGVYAFGLRKIPAVITHFVSFAPASVLFVAGASQEDLGASFAPGALLLMLSVFHWLFSTDEDQLKLVATRVRERTQDELVKLRRTQFLSKHFPPKLRNLIESGEQQLPERRIHPYAVVGFADITNSTQIANVVGLERDWVIKQDFFAIASKRATSCGMIVLNHTGDGFMFLANFDAVPSSEWQFNVVSFFEGLAKDWGKIQTARLADHPELESGIKIGIALGPAVIGSLGDEQSYFTAIGPDVNLAARLCALAGNNELVMSGKAWFQMDKILFGWKGSGESLEIKGFAEPVPLVRLDRRLGEKRGHCVVCQQELSLLDTKGFIYATCLSGHDQGDLASRIDTYTFPPKKAA